VNAEALDLVRTLAARGLDVNAEGVVSMRPGMPPDIRGQNARTFARTGTYLSAAEKLALTAHRADLPEAVKAFQAAERAEARRAKEARLAAEAEAAAKNPPKPPPPAQRPAPTPPPQPRGDAWSFDEDVPFNRPSQVQASRAPATTSQPGGPTHPAPTGSAVVSGDVAHRPRDTTSPDLGRHVAGPGAVPGAHHVDHAPRGDVQGVGDASTGTPARPGVPTGVQAVSAVPQSAGAPVESVVTCSGCGTRFTTKRTNTRTCGPTCRKRLSRARKAPPVTCAAETVTCDGMTGQDATSLEVGDREAVGHEPPAEAFGEADAGVTVEDLQEVELIRVGAFELLMEGGFDG
jgi:hypothetical protein